MQTFMQAEEEVNRVQSNYELQSNKPLDDKVILPMNSPADMLDIMYSFNYIKPLPKKCGQIVSLCTCADAYQFYCCVKSVLLSLMFNPEFDAPDIAL